MTLLWLSGAFVVGAWLVLTPGGGWSPLGLALFLWAAAIVFVVIRERAMHRRLLPVMVGLLLVLGLIRVSLSEQSLPSENLPVAFHAGAIAFEAILITEPRPYGGATRLPLSVLKVFDADGNAVELDPPIAIDVLADRLFGTLDRGSTSLRGFRYGDTYRVTGRFQSRSTDEGFPPGISPDAVGVVTSATVRLIDNRWRLDWWTPMCSWTLIF